MILPHMGLKKIPRLNIYFWRGITNWSIGTPI